MMEEDLEGFAPKIAEVEQVMKDREAHIEDTKEKMNSVEDTIFGKFCDSIGVSNIRQYEERELKTQQDREKKKLDFENQINRITNQLEYERKREDQLMANVQKFERAVQDDEDALETAKKIEAQQMSEIDGDMRDVDKLKQNKGFLKSQCDKFEDEVNAARREVAGVVKEMQSANKGINQLEAAVEQEKADRHSLLKHCKMFNIPIPMSKGNLEDIDDDGQNDDPSIELSNSQPSHVIYEKEAKIKINYSGLDENLIDNLDNDDVKKVEKTLEKQINELQATITKIQAPNMRAMQKLDEAREKLEETNKEFDNARKKAKQAKINFER